MHFEKVPSNLIAVIFIPKNRKRGNLKKLKILSTIFNNAWELAKERKYWEAMTMNGLATASILNSDPKIIVDLIEKEHKKGNSGHDLAKKAGEYVKELSKGLSKK